MGEIKESVIQIIREMPRRNWGKSMRTQVFLMSWSLILFCVWNFW